MEKNQRAIEIEAKIQQIDLQIESIITQIQSAEKLHDDKKISVTEYVLSTTKLQSHMTQLIEEREACHRQLLSETEPDAPPLSEG
jgi:hypothetical protein